MFKPLPFAIIVALLAALAVGKSIPDLWALSQHGMTTTGAVVDTRCGKKGSYRVRFKVNGKPFDAWSHGGVRITCRDLRGGETAIVYYLPEDPTVTTGREPRNELIETILFTFGFAGALGFAGYIASTRVRNIGSSRS